MDASLPRFGATRAPPPPRALPHGVVYP
uniref:Uncharacterized protein n=1 Tax=Arundo donax TaxID=35708 RepID=A0A0A9C874_ARUDO